MSVVTCHTEGCINAEVDIDIPLSWVDEDTGETHYVNAVVCGACGQPIDVDLAKVQAEDSDGG